MDILMGHFIGDYVLQTDWMGMNKSKNDWVCALHSLIYTLSVAACVNCWLSNFMFTVALQHFIFDRDRRLIKWLIADRHFKWATDRERMWLMFFYDNLSHLFTIWILLKIVK